MEMSTKRNIIHKDYEVLELKPGASLINIKKAYKKLVKKWHPDLFPSHRPKAQEKAHQMFRQISDAYARVIKLHQERSNKNFTGRQQHVSPYNIITLNSNNRYVIIPVLMPSLWRKLGSSTLAYYSHLMNIKLMLLNYITSR